MVAGSSTLVLFQPERVVDGIVVASRRGGAHGEERVDGGSEKGSWSRG